MSRHLKAFTATATFTPAAVAYSANDVISVAQAMQWVDANGLVYPGGLLLILSSRFYVNATGVISGETSYNLHLYNVTPTSAHADNAAWDIPDTDLGQYQDYLSLGTPVDVGTNLRVPTDAFNRPISVSPNVNGKTFAELVTVGGFTATAKDRVVILSAIDLSR